MMESNAGAYSSDNGLFAPGYVTSPGACATSELNHSLDDAWSFALPPAISPASSISPSNTLFDESSGASQASSPGSSSGSHCEAGSSPSSSSSSSARTIKMRGAKRDKVRKQAPPPALPASQQRARDSHNLVEKKYRNRLNQEFELLLTALTRRGSESGSSDGGGFDESRAFTKTAVLKLARQTLQDLEDRNRMLSSEIKSLGGFS